MFSPTGRIFEAMNPDQLALAGEDSPLPVPLHFQTAKTLTVTDIEQCVAACSNMSAGSCQAFYLDTDTDNCHTGTFATQDSGAGALVTDALFMFVPRNTSVGMPCLINSDRSEKISFASIQLAHCTSNQLIE